jgi:hypothetical protein
MNRQPAIQRAGVNHQDRRHRQLPQSVCGYGNTNTVQHDTAFVDDLDVPFRRRPAAAKIIRHQVLYAGASLGARRLQVGEIAAFLIADQSSNVVYVEVIAHRAIFLSVQIGAYFVQTITPFARFCAV